MCKQFSVISRSIRNGKAFTLQPLTIRSIFLYMLKNGLSSEETEGLFSTLTHLQIHGSVTVAQAAQAMNRKNCHNVRCDWKNMGLVRDLNPGPRAPEARIIPLDQRAS